MHVYFAGWLGSLQVAECSVPIILSKQKEINDWEELGYKTEEEQNGQTHSSWF